MNKSMHEEFPEDEEYFYENDLEDYNIEFSPHGDTSKKGCIKYTGERFHIGQVYEDEKAKQIQCKFCNSKDFHVAIGSYYTAIKCKTCSWEMAIHEG